MKKKNWFCLSLIFRRKQKKSKPHFYILLFYFKKPGHMLVHCKMIFRRNKISLSDDSKMNGQACVTKFGLVWYGLVWCYLRPVSGCTKGGCDTEDGGTPGTCLGLLTFVLDLANSSRMVWGRSGSNRTPCCKWTIICINSFTVSTFSLLESIMK